MAERNVRTISTHSLIERENKKVRGKINDPFFFFILIYYSMARC